MKSNDLAMKICYAYQMFKRCAFELFPFNLKYQNIGQKKIMNKRKLLIHNKHK